MAEMIRVLKTGSVFDGSALITTDAALQMMLDTVGDLAVQRARQLQEQNIQVHVTGAEPASLHVEKSTYGEVVTDDHNIKYGPWLEGTGSRNQSTRFKGYGSLRDATQEINQEAAEVTMEAAMRPFIEKLNL